MSSGWVAFVSRVALPCLGPFYNRRFWPLLSLWERTQYWERERLDSYRWDRCQSLIRHALETVPFYRDLARREGLTADSFRSFPDLSLLPVLGKEDYRREGVERFRSEAVATARPDSTSGTSGSPFLFYNDRQIEAAKMARLIRENRWAGWRPGERYLRLWGPHRESRGKRLFYDLLMRRHEVNAFHVERDFDRIVEWIERRRPRVVEAYTSAAVLFARLCSSRGVRLDSVRSIVVSAEGLTDRHRELIGRAFAASRVYDRYGCREVGNIAHECSHGGLHVNAESFHLEEEANPSIAGGKNLVVTCFDNLAMPFLRYRIGDLARLEDGRCGCGRTLPLMSSVTGRTTDFFSLASGAELSFLFFNHFFEQYGGIVDLYQVEQTAADRLSIRIVAGSRFEPGEEGRIRERLLSEWGDRVAIDVERVDGIEREKSGKLRVYRPLRA